MPLNSSGAYYRRHNERQGGGASTGPCIRTSAPCCGSTEEAPAAAGWGWAATAAAIEPGGAAK
ncbi:hypothetical protein EYF80_022982 [Liparis tanakae]|uniref:Uncharacterized protein n=1 Tax=Liparis tanakae TaxID=230148 RepID=A0A4Z2HMD7_9TELE|nr:hypothetical protein EYF80_022982 [Liparis tanakae]